VIEAGVLEGPEIGRFLAQVEDWWVANDFAPDQGGLRDHLHEIIAQDRP
jgi:hypothetical protein